MPPYTATYLLSQIHTQARVGEAISGLSRRVWADVKRTAVGVIAERISGAIATVTAVTLEPVLDQACAQVAQQAHREARVEAQVRVCVLWVCLACVCLFLCVCGGGRCTGERRSAVERW
jgi:hypothetical protein